MSGIGLGISFSSTAAANSARVSAAATAIGTVTAKRMARAVLFVYRDLVKYGLTGEKQRDPFWGWRGASGARLGVRTGNTRRSVVTRVFKRLNMVFGIVGSNSKVLAVHEKGATIHGNPYLRLPTIWALSKGGASKDAYAGRSVRGIPGTFIGKSKRGNLFIGLRTAGGKSFVPLFILKESVTLRPRHIMRNTVARTKAEVLKIMQQNFAVEVFGGH